MFSYKHPGNSLVNEIKNNQQSSTGIKILVLWFDIKVLMLNVLLLN